MAQPRKYTIEHLIVAVSSSGSFRQVLQKLGLKEAGGNYHNIKTIIKQLNLDVTHFHGQAHLKGKTHTWAVRKPWGEILILGSYLHPGQKKRLFIDGLLPNICAECGQKNQWNNKPLVLHIDHINGNHQDNRIENLRPLCPNCHSQTTTYCGRNIPKPNPKPPKIKPAKFCPCGRLISKNARFCKNCANLNSRKIVWPDIQTLLSLLEKMSFVKVGKLLGVSDNAIRKHLEIFHQKNIPVQKSLRQAE